MKQWYVSFQDKLSDINKVDQIIKILLANRGLTKPKEISGFLNPQLSDISIKSVGLDKKQLSIAKKRILSGIKNKEKIVVYSDYDVDGILGGAIVWEALYGLKAKVMPYISDRVKEGYGFSKTGLDFIKKEYNTSLIVAVDHGVSAKKHVSYARKLGMETVIIDHHILPPDLPESAALVHTTKLCAAGVAWMFCNYLLDKEKDENLDLVAMATIADMIPLVGVNRSLVYHGLKKLNHTKRLGLNALMNESGLVKGNIGTHEVGHILAPRLNALGRVAHALDVLRLICTKDEDRARDLSQKLSQANRDRQTQTVECFGHAVNYVKQEYCQADGKINKSAKLLFVSHQSYHQGVIGLVAGRLVEEFNLPSVVISIGEEYSKASARSVNGFDIISALRQASDLLVDVGGHPMAAGFTVMTDKIQALKEKMNVIAGQNQESSQKEKVIKIDMEIPLPDITEELYNALTQMAPFGISNPQPVFASWKLSVLEKRLVGREGKHLRLSVGSDDGNAYFKCIGFGLGEWIDKIGTDAKIDICYTIEKNSWNGRDDLQLKLKDIRIN